MAAKIVSFINFKGGVGKTATAVNIAAYLAEKHEKKVLLADLDPQANASFYLLKEEVYESRRNQKGTLMNILESYSKKGSSSVKIDDVIIHGVLKFEKSEVNKIRGEEGLSQVPYNISSELGDNLDLLPGDLSLIDIDYLFQEKDPHKQTVVAEEFEKVKDKYDYIICDCPPNLYMMTTNALYASDNYIVPVIPDYLSSIGLPLLLARVDILSKASRRKIPCAGIIFSKVRPGALMTLTQQRRISTISNDPNLKRLGIKPFPEPFIHEREDLRKSEESNIPVCVYDPQCTMSKEYEAASDEFVKRV